MKKIVSTIAFVLAASSAMAADAVLDVPSAPVADVAPAFSWTGFTAGVQGGYGWNNNDVSVGGLAGETSADFDGAIAGGFVGFNYDLGNSWVVGVEADFEKNWGDDSATLFGTSLDYGFDWQGSVRGRVGYAFDRALIYGTAGWAYARGYAEVPGVIEEKETVTHSVLVLITRLPTWSSVVLSTVTPTSVTRTSILVVPRSTPTLTSTPFALVLA
jgi:outer membrane immunogenic protein